MILGSVNSSNNNRGYIVLGQLIITVGTLFTVAGLPSPQTGTSYGGGQPQAGGLPQQQSTPLPPGIPGALPGNMGSPGSGTASFPVNANSQGVGLMPPGSQITVGVGGVRRNYAGWREWRRADPTLINTLWRNKMGNGIRKQLGKGVFGGPGTGTPSLLLQLSAAGACLGGGGADGNGSSLVGANGSPPTPPPPPPLQLLRRHCSSDTSLTDGSSSDNNNDDGDGGGGSDAGSGGGTEAHQSGGQGTRGGNSPTGSAPPDNSEISDWPLVDLSETQQITGID